MISQVVYLVFLVMIIAAGAVGGRHRKQLLMLAASYLFYGIFGLEFLGILIASSVLNFALGSWLRRHVSLTRLWVGILFNVALLSFFKYLPSGMFHGIEMPIGISFWTFQALSYLFDLYHEEELDPTLLEFCLYMAFWPTVLLGPICRLSTMLPQFREFRRISMDDLAYGTRRIAAGLFMKLILSQLLAPGVNAGFHSHSGGSLASAWSGLDVWFLAFGFGFQLFFDFAGYSNIVIGAARLFGFRLEENFDAPYLATTPSIFWTKWHMSLSSWIRDYVFMPLATRRREPWWRYFVLCFSMVIFGLWHGAGLTFLLWGVWHGILLMTHRLGQQLQRTLGIDTNGRILNVVSWTLTFLSVSLGWIAFRAESFAQASAMIRSVFSPASYQIRMLPDRYYLVVISLVGGYFLYSAIERGALTYGRRLLSSPLNVELNSLGQMARFFSENVWMWGVPVLAVLAILAALIIYQRVEVDVSPFVYTRF